MEIDEDEDTEQSEESETSNEDVKIQHNTENFEDDKDNGFDDVD